jgi:hypothetical protein
LLHHAGRRAQAPKGLWLPQITRTIHTGKQKSLTFHASL